MRRAVRGGCENPTSIILFAARTDIPPRLVHLEWRKSIKVSVAWGRGCVDDRRTAPLFYTLAPQGHQDFVEQSGERHGVYERLLNVAAKNEPAGRLAREQRIDCYNRPRPRPRQTLS